MLSVNRNGAVFQQATCLLTKAILQYLSTKLNNSCLFFPNILQQQQLEASDGRRKAKTGQQMPPGVPVGECTRHHNTQMSTPLGGMWDEKAKQRKKSLKDAAPNGAPKSFLLFMSYLSKQSIVSDPPPHTHILHTAS